MTTIPSEQAIQGHAGLDFTDPYTFGSTVTSELIRLFLGEEIGTGVARRVYRFALDSTLVVKVETRQAQLAGGLQNAVEWMTWNAATGTKWAKWFAPCRWLSQSGSILIMDTTVAIREEEIPLKVPRFISDTKVANWGMLGGRPVVHDYGLPVLFELGLKGGKKKTKRTRPDANPR